LKGEKIMMDNKKTISMPKLVYLGFSAGFFSALIFKQMIQWVFWQLGLAPASPYIFTATPPLDIHAALSPAIWGGAWGALLALAQSKFSQNEYWYWTMAFGFGAILPSLVAFLITIPLEVKFYGGSWHWSMFVSTIVSNGVWGFGTAGVLNLAMVNGFRASPGSHDSGASTLT
jgi:hypothetical protein